MKRSLIKSPAKLLVPACAALAMLSPGAQAESTYGYRANGTPNASARARVDLQINVPTLILLRVGTAGAVRDRITITATPSGAGLPGGLSNGNNQAITWTGDAPTITGVAAPASVTAYAWTNSAGGGSVNGALAGLNTGGLTGASVTVTPTALTNGGLAHPGATLAAFAPVGFAANTLVSSTWAYSVTPAALETVTAGQHTGTVTYTATAL